MSFWRKPETTAAPGTEPEAATHFTDYSDIAHRMRVEELLKAILEELRKIEGNTYTPL